MQLEWTMAWVVILVGVLVPPIVGLLGQPRLTRAILRDLRLPRILHFVTLGGLGMALHLRNLGAAKWENWEGLALQFAFLIVSLTYAAVFAIVTNNLEDLEADRISNPGRPLVTGAVNRRAYLVAGIVCEVVALGLAVLGGFCGGAGLGLGVDAGNGLGLGAGLGDDASIVADYRPELLIGILAISVGYYVYSCRPFRLKRIPVVAKLLIGFNSWAVAVCGFALAGGEWSNFPWIWSVFILVPLSFAANFIDLKDIAGDKATGIGTLPVLLGERIARHVIALATLATYGMGGILLGVWWAYPLNAVAAVVHLYLLYRKPYDERLIFLVYVGALVGLDIFLVWP